MDNKTNINCLIGNYATYFEKPYKIRVKYTLSNYIFLVKIT